MPLKRNFDNAYPAIVARDIEIIVTGITTTNEFKIELINGPFVNIVLNAINVNGSGSTKPLPPAFNWSAVLKAARLIIIKGINQRSNTKDTDK
tara:strand:- start:99 stop:377 length:279 start_codon:yes stop_codon:yes gene_type:complete